jgi:tRNA threonylcarbamoyladenosine biosynthesis protein TsaE
VEWPERGGHALPPPDLRLDLKVAGTGREAVLRSGSAAGSEWLERLSKMVVCEPLLNPSGRK